MRVASRGGVWGFVWWIGYGVYYGCADGKGEGVGSACVAHYYGDDFHYGAMPM
jgi:hypothetical protein